MVLFRPLSPAHSEKTQQKLEQKECVYNATEIENELQSLSAFLTTPMTNSSQTAYTTAMFVELVKRSKVKIISLLHVGEDGLLKTLDFCPLNEDHLIAILEGGERCDGSSIFPHSGIPTSSSDIVLRPRLETAFFDPFAQIPRSVLCIFCWHYGTDGELLEQSPESILCRAEDELLKKGQILWAHGEVEFFLGKETESCFQKRQIESDHGYHAAAPYVFGQDLRREAIEILAKLGVHVKYAHSENGYIESDNEHPITWEQHEIELALEPLNKAARSTVLTKWVLSSLAQKYQMHISFEPICREGHIGSGFHVHMSPRHSHGPNDYRLIRDENTHRLSSEAVRLIAGLSQLGGALMAFGNRSEESSFVRLSQGKEAPSTVCWGDLNRHALIRLPLVAKNQAGKLVAPPTIEFRLGDGSAHPYFLMAGLAMAMLYGLDMKEDEAKNLVEATAAEQQKRISLDGENSKAASVQAHRKVPRSQKEVARELCAFRHAFERAGVFPTSMIDAMVS